MRGLWRDERGLGRNPDVHHLVPVRAFVESADHERTDSHALENVASLCVGCHRKAEFGEISASRLREAVEVAAPSDTPGGGGVADGVATGDG